MLLIFDCDGVLVDSEMIANRVLAAQLSRYGYPVTAAECRQKFIGNTIPGVIKMVADEGIDLPEDFEAILREKDADVFARELRPVAGMQATLEHLHSVPKCVASSGSPDKIRTNLQTTGLLGYFDPYLFSTREVRKPKPAPDIFLLAADRTGFSHDQCIVIEDTPLGIEGAKRAGMQAFGFIGASHRVPADESVLLKAGADLVFADMTQLPSLLKR
ncbi:MAG: hypothetical protein COV67_12785 [Nitrospinae bacterium CG11_big_fil_rev_8_21_14_0_20_56_8]|nr:MAG: hypothetical protein COV67_12785 [Nitrospinae bacterium CG11_big_fil_rev_8_21_14_0_20_56_8]